MLGNVLMLSFLIFFVFGIIGIQLWQGKLRNRCFTNFTVASFPVQNEPGTRLSTALLTFQAQNPGAPNEYFSENGPLTTENQTLDAFKAFSSTFLCCWKEFICSSLPAG